MRRSRTAVPKRRRRRAGAAPPGSAPAAWRPLATFAVAVLRRDARGAARALAAARRAGVRRVAAEEAALLLVPHAGVPAALEAMRALAAAWPGRARATPAGAPATWRRRGRRLFVRVYGPVAPRLDAALQELHPDLRAWIVEVAYGRMLARTGLDALALSLRGTRIDAHRVRFAVVPSAVDQPSAPEDAARMIHRLGATGPAWHAR